MLQRALSVSIFLALFACEKESMPQKPQILVDREEVDFGFAFVGTKPQESLAIRNGGIEDLEVSSVTVGGDSQFTVACPPECVEPSEEPFDCRNLKPCAIKGKDRRYFRIVFAPAQLKAYSGTITINSNAENAPQKVVNLTGRGASPADAGQ